MASNLLTNRSVNWRWAAAATTFLLGFVGLLAGASVSERPDVVDASVFTKAYYTLGLFVVGGLDIGTPNGGPAWAQTSLWLAYFAAPALTAGAVIETIVRVMTPGRWQLRNLRDHTIIFGSGELTLGYLHMLRERDPGARVVVVDEHFERVREEELRVTCKATPVVGALTNTYLLSLLRLDRAKRVFLLGDNDFQSFEAAAKILQEAPDLAGNIIIRCHNLRFMRSVQQTALYGKCQVFNSYNLAATGFVQKELIDHFERTASKDVVVMAGFGRFGQSVIEELQANASGEIARVAVIDQDADRRILVVDEQERIRPDAHRSVFQGDISHPAVWNALAEEIDLSQDEPTVILGTGNAQENLRTSLWLKARYPNIQVFTRTTNTSTFALEVGKEHGIKSISMNQLVEDNMPEAWLT